MRFVLLLVAAIIAVVAGVAALKWTAKPPPETTQVATTTSQNQSANLSTVDVLVARDVIPVGTIIEDEMVSRQPWPSHLVLESFVLAGSVDGNVIGKVARTTFLPYEPLLKSRLGNPNDPSFLAAALPQGMRAMTIGTDTISGVAGYIFPGDRVDLLVTHNVPKEAKMQRSTSNQSGGNAAAGNRPAFAEVLVPNARVLAVNLRRVNTPSSGPVNTAPTSITLEVPDEVAQQVRLAEKLGTISLTLRSLKDMDGKTPPPPPATFENLTRAGLLTGGHGVKIVRGVEKDEDYESGISALDNMDESPEAQGSSMKGEEPSIAIGAYE